MKQNVKLDQKKGTYIHTYLFVQGLSRRYPAMHYEKLETFIEADTRHEKYCT